MVKIFFHTYQEVRSYYPGNSFCNILKIPVIIGGYTPLYKNGDFSEKKEREYARICARVRVLINV